MVLIIKQNLVNLNHQNNRFIVKITKSKYLDHDTGDGLRPNYYHCVENHQSAAWFRYILREIDNQVFLGVDWLEHLWAECNRRICLGARACGLAEFMFSDRYHLTFSASATVCPIDDGSHAMNNDIQLLKDISFIVAIECLPKGEGNVL